MDAHKLNIKIEAHSPPPAPSAHRSHSKQDQPNSCSRFFLRARLHTRLDFEKSSCVWLNGALIASRHPHQHQPPSPQTTPNRFHWKCFSYLFHISFLPSLYVFTVGRCDGIPAATRSGYQSRRFRIGWKGFTAYVLFGSWLNHCIGRIGCVL